MRDRWPFPKPLVSFDVSAFLLGAFWVPKIELSLDLQQSFGIIQKSRDREYLRPVCVQSQRGGRTVQTIPFLPHQEFDP